VIKRVRYLSVCLGEQDMILKGIGRVKLTLVTEFEL
jgi:hypothetical protein